MVKYDIGVVGRHDGMGNRDDSGSYIKLVIESDSTRHEYLISEGAAEVLAAELRGVTARPATAPSTGALLG